MNKEQLERMIFNLKLAATAKFPTLYVVQDYVTGRGLPTSWNSVYIIKNTEDGPEMCTIFSPEHMKKRRKDNNLYWHVHGYGTSHTHLVKQQIERAFGVDLSKFHTRII